MLYQKFIYTVAALMGLSNLLVMPDASAVVGNITLGEAGAYVSLSSVVNNPSAGFTSSIYPGTLVGTLDPNESNSLFTPGGNISSQQSNPSYTTAKVDLRAAIDYVKNDLQPSATVLSEPGLSTESFGGGALGVFPVGIYKTTDAMTLAGGQTITLAGGVDDKFIFISGKALNFGATSQITFTGGAQAKNLYWVVGTNIGDAVSGGDAILSGNFLINGSFTIGAGTHIAGRVLAMDTITFGGLSSIDSIPLAISTSPALTPTFGTPTPTAGGYTVQVSNYSASYTWVGSATEGGTVAISETGLVTVTGVASATTSVATITTTRTGYTGGSATISGTSTSGGTTPVLSIVFTDTTLIDLTISSPYSDFIKAEARTDGVFTSTPMTYAVHTSTPLPTGLSLNTSTGYVTGTLPDGAATGSFSCTFIASSSGFPTQTLAFIVKILPRAPGGGGGGGSTPAPLLSIEFTDQTLEPPTIGVLFSDYLAARTLSNGSPDSHVVTYVLASGSPALPLGLVLNPTTGFVTGTIESSVLSGTINLLFTASSPGYTSVTTTVLSYLVVQAAEIVPGEVLAEDVLATEIVDLPTANEFSSDTSSAEKPIPPTKKLLMTALFANNSSILSKPQIAAIKTLSKALLQMNIKTITIVGFTNSAPSVGNKKLAIARAKTLARYLKLNGIKQSITIKSLVTAKTKANQSASALIALRKAEIWIVSLDDEE